jgi:glyoxalase family protein
MITGDAQGTVDFYADLLGLRLVKTTVNFDDPSAYHLYFGDEQGSPGSILTWFEYPGARPGHPGPGMVHTLELGVPSPAALDAFAERLARRGVEARRGDGALRFEDPDGLRLALVVADAANRPLRAAHPDVPAEIAITGVEALRAFAPYARLADPVLTEVLGFEHLGGGEHLLAGTERRVRVGFDQPTQDGRPGAGTVHHVAWTTEDAEQLAWQERIAEAGGYVTPVQDRDYFRSIYFREPRGILHEIATVAPGFAVDEAPAHLGEELRVPAQHAHLRDRLARTLTPLANPRSGVRVAG